MKKLRFIIPLAVATLAFASSANADIIQTVAGPVAGVTGTGTTLIDTTGDTDNWIDTFNAGSTVFIGFDWLVSNNTGETGSGGFFGGLGFYDGSTERGLAGNFWESTSYGLSNGGALDTGTALAVGTVRRLVVETNSSSDLATLSVYDTSDNLISTTGSQAFTWNNITQITSRAGNSPGAASISDLVVATSQTEALTGVAVPEPSSIALLGLGLVGLVGRRRRS